MAETNTGTVAATNPGTVRIRIPKTREDQGDVFVSVNDRTWVIQRGKYVDVPACVAEVLQHQEEMMETIMAFDAAYATEP